jgi:hypothetical protein
MCSAVAVEEFASVDEAPGPTGVEPSPDFLSNRRLVATKPAEKDSISREAR